ncbi:PREDICTED: lipopolysaccharide-induced tumor necrosis factor-alpha factor homolog [Nicrophorus vespilloides]|uniref:Lipopolysaccharide-induced tumor necrosis factor-alpha factor homolog n=1 Tax=Nicrophorus vespilloides TaxID=110193 RepID=A0ABM1MCU9_NICVS|nr:PREDICTED: lipopolysaccharide-induced tumor necrosis factor-alpha factor homolog [Nicrophorus vespilloides]
MSTSYNNISESRSEDQLEMMQKFKFNRPPEKPSKEINMKMNTPRVLPSIPPVQFGPDPQRCICHSCHADISTTVKSKTNLKTHFMAMCMCLTCCFLCAWLPYCMKSCRNRNHFCPSCDSYLGKYE